MDHKEMETMRKGRYELDDPRKIVGEAKETKEIQRERKQVRDIRTWRDVSECGETSNQIKKVIELAPPEDE